MILFKSNYPGKGMDLLQRAPCFSWETCGLARVNSRRFCLARCINYGTLSWTKSYNY